MPDIGAVLSQFSDGDNLHHPWHVLVPRAQKLTALFLNSNRMVDPKTSYSAGFRVRAKAFGFLLLPFVAFAAVVLLALSYQRRLDSHRGSTAAQPSGGDDSMSIVLKKNSAPQISGATSVTTYIVTGKY
jgi:hypothetical protein